MATLHAYLIDPGLDYGIDVSRARVAIERSCGNPLPVERGSFGWKVLHAYAPPGLRARLSDMSAHALGEALGAFVPVIPPPRQVFASFAAGWLHRQLLRPVNRHDWLKGGKVVASRWQLGDSGLVLRTQAKLPALLLRTRPADVVVRER